MRVISNAKAAEIERLVEQLRQFNETGLAAVEKYGSAMQSVEEILAKVTLLTETMDMIVARVEALEKAK